MLKDYLDIQDLSLSNMVQNDCYSQIDRACPAFNGGSKGKQMDGSLKGGSFWLTSIYVVLNCRAVIVMVNYNPLFTVFCKKMKKAILCLVLLISVVAAIAQPATDWLTPFNQERFDMNKRGFVVLGSWSAANIIAGIVGQSTTSGQAKYFHQMNMIWGSVNLLIALPGYIGARRSNSHLTLAESLKGQSAVEKTFILNAGLDLAYITGGIWLLEKGNNKNPDKYKGWGKSVLVQGAFLLLFDAVMFTSHNRHGKRIYKAMEGLRLGINGVGLNIRI